MKSYFVHNGDVALHVPDEEQKKYIEEVERFMKRFSK